MPKKQYTVYNCDRCGKKISGTPFYLGKHKFLHVLKWCMPIYDRYNLYYLCDHCKKSFLKWAKMEEDDGGH